MEDNNTPIKMTFDSPKDQSSYIKVIGVGGGGGNAVNNMYQQGINGVDFIVCNTDIKALNTSPVSNKIQLADLGAGNDPEVARQAAMEHKDEIREALSNNTQMLFITAGMGGGTGTGASPVIAEIAKQIELDDPVVKHILVVAIVTVPFSFEGRRRKTQAENGINELRKHVDSILVINNDKLQAFGDLPLNCAFKKADDVLYTAVKGIAEIITVNANVNIDFHDVNTVMQHSGTALMGAGMGKGENRAEEAIKAASSSVLLNDNDIKGAQNVLLYFSYSPDHQITMSELGYVTEYIKDLTGDSDDCIWGAGTDDTLTDELKITLIATGFEQASQPEEKRIKLEPEAEKPVRFNPIDSNPLPPETPKTEPAAQGEKFYLDVLPENEEEPQAERITYAAQIEEVNDGIVIKSTPAPAVPEAQLTQPVQPVVPVQTAQSVASQPQPVQQVPTIQEPIASPVAATPAINEPAPVQSQEIGGGFFPFNEPSVQEKKVDARSERIRHMNEILHNNPDGPVLIENMRPYENIPQYCHDAYSRNQSGSITMNQNGDMRTLNSFLFNNPD